MSAKSILKRFEKTARVFGTMVPEDITEASIPESVRLRMYKNYLSEKAGEPPTSLGTALTTGGVLGAIPGAFIGAGMAKRPLVSGALGALVGGGLGAGLGALMRKNDIDDIEAAKVLQSAEPETQEDAFARNIGSMLRMRRAREQMDRERRHRELTGAIQSVGEKRGSIAAYIKEARDMPHFTDQDRPKKVKEIYRALKRDHPDMPAEMKARIAARQGKKGHQKQGPPYKGPIEPWKEKNSSLSIALDLLWETHTPDFEKGAAANYFYQLQKPSIDREALGEKFCKLARVTKVDPWVLAREVEDNLPAFQHLAKTASDPRIKELAGFYSRWADETIEKVAIFGAIHKGFRVAKAGLGQAARNLRPASRKMTEAIATGGKVAPQRTIGGAMKREAANVNKIRAAGGGSYARGNQVLGLKGGKAVPKTPPAPQGAAPSTAMTKAPPTQPAPTTPPATKPVPKKGGFTTGEKAIGLGTVGLLGAGGMYLAGQNQQPQQPQYGY